MTGTICSPGLPRVLSAVNWERPLLRWIVLSFRNLAGLLLLAVTSVSARKWCFLLPGLACFVRDVFYYWDFSVARQPSLPGFFTFARLKAADCWHTALSAAQR